MGLGGLVLGGALQGIGAGIVAQGKQSAETAQQEAQGRARLAEQDAMMRREIALENLRNQNTIARDENKSKLTINEVEAGARADDWKGARQTARTTDSTITVDRAKTQNDITVKQIEAANARTLAKLNSSLNINEKQAEIAAETVAAASRAGFEVGDTQIRNDGALVLLAKTGKIISVSKPGLFTPEGSGDAPISFPGTKLPAPSSAAQPVPANRPPLSSFDR